MSERTAAPANDSLSNSGFIVNVNFVFVSTITTYSLAFLYIVVIARLLGPEGRGITALYAAAVSLGYAFLSLGLSPAILYFVSRREQTARQALEVALCITLGAIAVTALTVLAIVPLLDTSFEADGLPYWLALVAMPGVVQHTALESVLRAQQRFLARNAVEILLPSTILTSLIVIELTAGLTVDSAIYAWSLAYVPTVMVGYLLVGRSNWPRGLAPLKTLLTSLRFGVQAQLSNLFQLLNYRLDSYLVLLFVNTAGVGLYAVGVSMSEGLWFIANSVSIVLLVNLTAADESYAARMAPIVCRNTLLVTGIAAIAVAVVAPVVIPVLFGSDFDEAVVPFLCLLPGTVALAGTKILASYVFSRGKPMINSWIALATLVTTVSGDFALIPFFEVTGAAIATSIAYGVSLTLTALAYRKLSGGSLSEALLPRFSDAALYREGLRLLAARLRLARANAGESVQEGQRGS
jgi:O-antigen/teichoic acid export membrane protein